MLPLVEIMDLTKISQNFPEYKNDEIERENFLNTITTAYEGDNNVIVLETKEGIGKTTLLAQFVRRNPTTAISLFTRPSSAYAYDPGVIRLDLCNQIHWILFQTEVKNPEVVDSAYMNNRLFELHRRAKRRRETIYFVIDGLDEIPAENEFILKSILDMLPIGLPGFTFLFSAQDGILSKTLSERKIKVKPLTLSGFSFDEASKYLKELNLNVDQLREIYHISKTSPGDLSNIKRIIQSGFSIDDLPQKLPEFFKIEWSKIDMENQDVIKLLAVTAHDQKEHSISELSDILQIDQKKIESMIEGISFIEVDPNKGLVKYVSLTYKKSVSQELKNYKEVANDLLIDYFLRDPSSEQSLQYLPGYLNKANRLGEIINYLSPSNFSSLINYSKSLSIVLQKADLGVDVSKLLKRDGDLMRFTINKSTIAENEGTKVWYSEVKARMALNDYDSAIALSQGTLLHEDRLHLLCIISRIQREKEMYIDPALNEQIQYLYDKVDPVTLGKRATEIATELIYSHPDLAIDLIEKSTKSEENGKAIDLAFATLSVAALKANTESSHLDVTIESIKSKIKNPEAKRFLNAASLLTKDLSALEVIFEVEKLDSTSDRLFLLRMWTKNHQEDKGASQVIEYALKLLIRTTEYIPQLRDLRELAAQLPSVSDVSKSKQLVKMIDAQKLTIENQGTTEDLIALELILAETEMTYDTEASRNRVIDVYLKISMLDEVYVKTVCLAQLLSSISKFDLKKTLEGKDSLHSISHDDFTTSLELLLNSSATHYQVTEEIIHILSKNKPEMALAITNKLNTEINRDKSKLELVEATTDVPITDIDFSFIQNVLDDIKDEELRGDALLILFSRLRGSNESVDESVLRKVLPFTKDIRLILDSEDRCKALCFAYKFISQQTFSHGYNGILNNLLRELHSSWDCIDVAWEKINVGFKITEILAKTDLEVAKPYLTSTENFREQIILQDKQSSIAYLASIRLITRSFAGLLPRNINTKEDMERIEKLISTINSKGEQAILWSDIALRCFSYKKNYECNAIVSEHIKPLLSNISPLDCRYLNKVIVIISPALYVSHKTTAFEIIDKLNRREKDNAYFQICEFILTKRTVFDPCDTIPGRGYDLSYEEIIDIIEILYKIGSDSILYTFIVDIINSMFTRQAKTRFTQQQTKDISERLEILINNKLPNKTHIEHDGFLIAAQAQVARIINNYSGWNKLVKAAESIPNLADVVYVLSIIAVAMPVKELDIKQSLIKRAQEIIEKIPVLLDRIEHYEALASMSLSFSTIISRSCIEKALKCATENNDPSLYPAQRRIIDLAHRIDPDLATNLVSSLDNDEVRSEARKNLKKELKTLELKNNILDISKPKLDNADDKISDYPKATTMLLSALNANRIQTVPIEQTRDILQVAASMPISKSFPILNWVIENVVRRYSNTKESSEFLRPLFESTILATELSLHIASRYAIVHRPKNGDPVNFESIQSILINVGEREKAIQYLKHWIENEVTDFIKICDPYFGPEDMELLQLIMGEAPYCEIKILTSKKHQTNERIVQPWDVTYRDYWRLSISDQDPPRTEIVIAGTKNQGALPIHDRWWITKGKGIRVGTSFNALGIGKVSEISILTKDEAELREIEIDRYLKRQEKEVLGDKLQYFLFNLD
jgi:hypothetical protein